MRELKFRVWDTSQEDWLHDCMLKETVFGCTSGYKHNSERGFAELHQNKDHLEYSIEQYTGLKDKNGKEIYEGDIVKYLSYQKEYTGQVVFDFVDDSEGYYVEKHYGWGIWRDDYNTSLGDYADNNMKCELIEVIGNIHENPELIGGEE